MIVTVSSRHMAVSVPLKEYAQAKAGKLTKYYDRISEIEVVIDDETKDMKVEMIVSADHNHRLVAHHADGDAYACIDSCVDKLERQLTDYKDKTRNRKHPAT
jgi:putative sigma-54 modulation protein